MNKKLYPLKFNPILKDKIWGGQKLKTLLNKQGNLLNIGESWEISDVEGDTSIVSNGFFKGKSLKYLQEKFTENLIGKKNYKVFENKFPLLIKFIDAKEDLSIQLHPNDKLSLKRHNSFGKTEMWYVMQADKDSNLIVGFNKKMDSNLYLNHLKKKTLPDILNFDAVKEGDVYFIQAGKIHAIGAGVMLAEIQQTSDITYRVYDWGRVDNQGNSRELHNDLAIDAIDFNMDDDFRVNYKTIKNKSNKMINCPYFTTHFIHITSTVKKVNTFDSFIIYICIEGEAKIVTDDFEETILKGETLMLPAVLKKYKIISNNAKFLEVYV